MTSDSILHLSAIGCLTSRTLLTQSVRSERVIEGRMEGRNSYLKMHSTHFIYGHNVLDIL